MMSDTLHRREAPPVSGGEFAFSWNDFRKIAALVHAESGIVLGEGKANLVYSRLGKRLRAIGLTSFRDYCALVTSEDGADERQAMIAAMTTNVTSFFRETHHFDYLTAHVLPLLEKKLSQKKPVRLWSSASSSGEEPYSLAMTVLQAIPDAASRGLLILASDLDPTMIARAEAGRYSAKQVESVPVALRRSAFRTEKAAQGVDYLVTDAVGELVRFRELNLLDPWPMRGKFDVIFCRNVMIYFDEQTQLKLWQRFASVLQPGGILCIGHSERVPGALPFDLVAQTTYRLRGTGRAESVSED